MRGQRSILGASTTAFRLSDLHVDPNMGLVSGSEGSVRLEPRVMAVLQALARRPGELVSRAELLSEIWTGGSVYDEALTQCVYQLRQQLAAAGGDDCRDLVNTVPKRGYLLNGTVQDIVTEPGQPDELPPAKRGWPLLIGALAILLLIGIPWATLKKGNGTDTQPGPGSVQTLAVLPFLPVVEGDGDPALELGMADTLIARLSGNGMIIVRPITSVRRYSALERNSLQAGRELGADAVVEGSIQRSGEVIRVTVRLLRVADGAALWADTFNEDFSGIFSVQDDICERIAKALAPELGKQGQKTLVRAGTSNAGAYELYLKGRYHLARLTPPDMRTSIDYFNKAVALDPGYAQAWLGLASAQFRIPLAGEAPPLEYYPKAKLAAQKALELDPTLAEGYAMLGWIANWFEWDWKSSETWFKQAIELDPNDTESHLGYAHLFANTGQVEQALIEVRRARELSPFYMVAAALEGAFLLRAKRPGEALLTLEAARHVDESFWLTRMSLVGVYMSMGRTGDALAQAEEARRLSHNSTWATANMIELLVRLDRRHEAESLVSEMLQRSVEHYVPPYDLATAYGGLGDDDAALAWLMRAFEARDPKLAFLGAGKSWINLRDRPEFIDLLRRMRLSEPPAPAGAR